MIAIATFRCRDRLTVHLAAFSKTEAGATAHFEPTMLVAPQGLPASMNCETWHLVTQYRSIIGVRSDLGSVLIA